MTFDRVELNKLAPGGQDLPGWRPSRAELRRRRRNRGRWFLSSLVILLLLAVLTPYGYYRSQVDGGSSKISVTVSASPGEGLGQFAGDLASKGVIGSTLIFRIWLRTQPSVVLQAGTYTFKKDDSYSRVVATLKKGPALDKLVIPDGLTLSQIAAKVGELPQHSAAHFLQVANSGQVRSPFEPTSGSSLEGLLYPDTYSFDPSTSDKSILQMMVNAFVTHALSLGLTPQTKSQGLDAYQLVILASIVEKEAVYPGDAAKVARVILNRLAQKMKLQLDSTVIYGLGNTVTHLSLADLQVKSPYNTYIISGLPPTPISLPSQTAIQASLNPASGNWLYYVVVNKNGAEAFSTTYAGQLANERLASSNGLG